MIDIGHNSDPPHHPPTSNDNNNNNNTTNNDDILHQEEEEDSRNAKEVYPSHVTLSLPHNSDPSHNNLMHTRFDSYPTSSRDLYSASVDTTLHTDSTHHHNSDPHNHHHHHHSQQHPQQQQQQQQQVYDTQYDNKTLSSSIGNNSLYLTSARVYHPAITADNTSLACTTTTTEESSPNGHNSDPNLLPPQIYAMSGTHIHFLTFTLNIICNHLLYIIH